MTTPASQLEAVLEQLVSEHDVGYVQAPTGA